MSKIKNDLVDWQKAIQELSNYEPTDKYVVAIHRIKQLEQELAEAKKDQARYQYVKAMTYDKFGEMSYDPVRFDEQVDAAIEETK